MLLKCWNYSSGSCDPQGDIIYQYDTQAVNASQPVDQLVPIQEKPMRGYSCPQNMEE